MGEFKLETEQSIYWECFQRQSANSTEDWNSTFVFMNV